MRSMRLILILTAIGGAARADETPAASAEEVFKERILPIFKSPDPSSCTECHLGAVDLKDYISGDQARTYAALREAGLVDPGNPGASKILKLILMEPETPSPVSREMRRKEYEAFRAWIEKAVKDPSLAGIKAKAKPAGPDVPLEVVRHARKDRLLASFIENVWSERQRCISCHAPGVPPNPKAAARKREWEKKYGAEVLYWMGGKTPAEAMDVLLASRILDLERPAKSLLLTKPTTQVKHEGGKKMAPGDRGWRQFLRFVEDYAAIRSGKYRDEDDLPAYVMTRQWLKVTGVPSKRFVRMQVDFHRKVNGRWAREPFATAISGAGRGRWAAPVEILADRSSEEFEALREARRLPAGTYQLRFYLDTRNLLARNPAYRFGPRDLGGVMVITTEGWEPDSRPYEGEMVYPMKRTAKEIVFPEARRGR